MGKRKAKNHTSRVKGMNLRVVQVTPDVASRILEGNVNNRPLRRRTVERYMREMEAGRWELSPYPVSVGADGVLVDGQHRLTAVVKSGCTVQMMVAYDVPHSAMQYIDTGAPRSVGDVIRVTSGKRNGARMQSLAGVWLMLEGEHPRKWQAREVEEYCEKYKLGFDWATGVTLRRDFRSALIVGSLSWVYEMNSESVDEFYELVTVGDGLRRDTPEHRLREWLLVNRAQGGRRSRTDTAFRVFNALHAFIEGRQVKKLYGSSHGYKHFARQLDLQKEDIAWTDLFTIKKQRQ